MTSEKGQLESRIPELDGLRGVAILLVVSFHYLEIPSNGGWLGNVTRSVLSFGWSGVDLFFVLSGFLIGGIVIDNRDATNRFRTFYIRRVCRIFPLYFLWLSFYYILPLLLPAGSPGSSAFAGEIPHFPGWGYVFFLQNFFSATTGNFGSLWMAATWSLAIEEQFYLFLPALMWIALPPRKTVVVLLVLIGLVPLFRIFLFLFQSSIFLYVLLPCRADALLFGVLCAYLVRLQPCHEWLRRNTKVLNAILLCLSVGMGYLVSLGYGRSALGVLNSFEMATYGFSLVALFYGCVLLMAIVNRGSLISGFLRASLLRHFGILAYGIFISHQAVRAIMLDLLPGVGGESAGKTALYGNFVSLLAFLVTWLLAALSWRFLEEPIVRWGHRFRYRPQTLGVSTEQRSNTYSTRRGVEL